MVSVSGKEDLGYLTNCCDFEFTGRNDSPFQLSTIEDVDFLVCSKCLFKYKNSDIYGPIGDDKAVNLFRIKGNFSSVKPTLEKRIEILRSAFQNLKFNADYVEEVEIKNLNLLMENEDLKNQLSYIEEIRTSQQKVVLKLVGEKNILTEENKKLRLEIIRLSDQLRVLM